MGAVNLPIIKFSVDWWNTLHQPAAILRLDGPTIDATMLTPLFLMMGAFTLFYIAVLTIRLRAEFVAAKIRNLRVSGAFQ